MKKLSIIFCAMLFFVNYAGAEEMKGSTEIEIIIGNEKAEGIVYDNNAGKSFLELLPLTIKMTDYNNTEKIGKVGNKINTKGEPQAYDPDKSDIAYYQPFGNLCFFYRDFGLSYSLYSVGKVTKSIEIFAGKNSDFEITVKRK